MSRTAIPTPPAVPLGLLRLAAGESAPAARKVSVVANTGTPMRPPGYGWVVIDLAGVDLPAAVPLLADHDASLGTVVGQGVPSVTGGQLVVAGALATGPAGSLAAGLLADGVALQASVGLEPTATRYVQPGDTVNVNGKRITAGSNGLTVVDRSRLFEVSLVPIGADQATSVSIAARGTEVIRATPTEPTMTAGTPPTVAADTPAAAPPPVQAAAAVTPPDAVAAERLRVREVMAITASGGGVAVDEFAAVRAKAIAEGWSVDQTRAAALDALKAFYGPGPNVITPDRPAGGGRPRGGVDRIAASLVARAGGEKAAERHFGAGVLNDLGRLRGASLVDLVAAALQADHRDQPANRSELIRAGLSMGTFPSAIGVAGRVLLEAAYTESPATWRAWCAVRPAADFRVHSTVRPNFAGNLSKLAPGGNIAHQTIGSDDAFAWQVATFARMLSVDRVDIINDDLNMLAEVIPSMGRTAARSIADLVYAGLLANTGSHFHSSNANLLTGSGSALGVTALTDAVRAMRVQRDSGNDLDIQPRVLLVPPELETPARQILSSEALARDVSDDQQPTGNPHAGSLTLAVEPRLSNPRFTGQSGTAWYLFAAPVDVPGIVGFLDGRQTPTVEMFGLDAEPSKLQVSYRLYWDYGFSLGDPKAGVKNAGA